MPMRLQIPWLASLMPKRSDTWPVQAYLTPWMFLLCMQRVASMVPTGEPPKNGVHDQLLACLESLYGHPV